MYISASKEDTNAHICIQVLKLSTQTELCVLLQPIFVFQISVIVKQIWCHHPPTNHPATNQPLTHTPSETMISLSLSNLTAQSITTMDSDRLR